MFPLALCPHTFNVAPTQNKKHLERKADKKKIVVKKLNCTKLLQLESIRMSVDFQYGTEAMLI